MLKLVGLALCLACIWCAVFFSFIAHRIYSAPRDAVEAGDVKKILGG